MSFLDTIGSAAGGLSQFFNLFGVAKNAAQRRALLNKFISKLNQKPPVLEIPPAYQNLSTNLNNQASQLGTAEKDQINQQFQQSLAHQIGDLQQRGLGSSLLNQNVTQGSDRQRAQALAGVDENVLAQRLGLQQNIGLQGLGEVAGERAQAVGGNNALYYGLINPLFGANSNPYGGITGALDSFGKYLNTPGATAKV